MKLLIKAILQVILKPLRWLTPLDNVIIIQTYSHHIYCENTRFLFEALSTNENFQVFWVTENEKIQEYLSNKNLKFITRSKPFHMISIVLKAKIIIDSGSDYFNFLGLVSKKAIKVSTMHGCGPKATAPVGDTLDEALFELKRMSRFDYVNFPSHYSTYMVGRQNLKLPLSKLLTLGYPRCDLYLDANKVQSLKIEKPLAKLLSNGSITNKDKVIFYTPTWRPYDYDFPFCLMREFDIEEFNSYLESNNSYFFYSFHTANIPSQKLPQSSRVIFVDAKKFPLYDTNNFMAEVDILINDYSTTSTDFALLSRPQIFFMPDYDGYFKIKGFIEDYRMVMPGPEIQSFNELTSYLTKYLNPNNNYIEEFESQRNMLLKRYYDDIETPSCTKWINFINTHSKNRD